VKAVEREPEKQPTGQSAFLSVHPSASSFSLLPSLHETNKPTITTNKSPTTEK
jgi:hypothetical protein